MATSSGGFRAIINRPIVSIVIIVVVIGIAIAIFRGTNPPVNHGQFYYTIDDGKTYFAAPLQVTPFTYKGKEAVQAHVFKCGDKTFVGYLSRYPEAVRTKVAAQLKEVQPGRLPNEEVKQPDGTNWISPGAIPGTPGAAAAPAAGAAGTPTYDEITQPKCPDGRFAIPQSPPQ